jgi:hypothetical protein
MMKQNLQRGVGDVCPNAFGTMHMRSLKPGRETATPANSQEYPVEGPSLIQLKNQLPD